MVFALEKFDAAKQALAEARSIDEVKIIRDQAEALRAYTKQAGDSLEMQNWCAEIKIRAERKAGELLKQSERHKGAATRSHDVTAPPDKLEDLGITKMQSSRWQKVAEVPEESFERHIEETKETKKELTTAGVLRMAVHYSSSTPEWYTPNEIICRAVEVLGEISLDPCSNSKDIPNVPAINHFTVEDDGLSRDWFGAVYMNPPYGSEISGWVEKLLSEWNAGNITSAVTLVPGRIDTKWYRSLRDFDRCEIAGRLKFSESENSAPFPSVAVYLGGGRERFSNIFSDIGDIFRGVWMWKHIVSTSN